MFLPQQSMVLGAQCFMIKKLLKLQITSIKKKKKKKILIMLMLTQAVSAGDAVAMLKLFCANTKK